MFTVTLQDFPGIPEKDRLQAERRYTKTLTRNLGGEEAFEPAYKAWINAEEAAAGELSERERSLALKGQKAVSKAMQDGFSGLGEASEAYFEVRLSRA